VKFASAEDYRAATERHISSAKAAQAAGKDDAVAVLPVKSVEDHR